jgi:hypothetical protein
MWPASGEEWEMNPTGTVVVGMDGSPESRAALEFALREPARRQARLRVIAAAQLPEYWAVVYGMTAMSSAIEVIADAKRIARQTVEEVVGDHPEPAVVAADVEAAADRREQSSSTHPRGPVCSCWATVAAERWAAPCWDRSSCTASCTRLVRSPSFDPPPSPSRPQSRRAPEDADM